MLINSQTTETLRQLYTRTYTANKADNVEVFKDSLKQLSTLCQSILAEIDTSPDDQPQLPPSTTETPPG